jgi:hypothetical protein
MIGAMLGWIAAAVLLGVAVARVFLGYPGDAVPRRCLNRREIAFLAAAADALFPRGGAIEWSGAEASIPGYVDRLVAASQPRTRLLMRLLFFLVEHGTLLFPAPGGVSGLRRFSSLDPARRIAVLDGWAGSRLFPRRLVFTSLRALATFGYFAYPPVLRALRLTPWEIDPPICEADLLYPRIGARSDSIALTREELSAPADAVPLALGGSVAPDRRKGAG